MMHVQGMTLRSVAAGSVSAMAMLVAGAVSAAEIDLMISDVDGKAGLVKELAERYQADNPDTKITINAVGYNVIREQLAVQLEAGSGPDLAFVTNLGGLNPFYVDLTPHVDAAEWEANYGAVLPWYRAGAPDGIFGFHTEMTVTGPYVNLTMFEEAEVEVPAAGATWEEWADAAQQVMDNTGSYAGMVMDRSGHRMAGPAMSYGAAYFSADGKLVADDGFKAFSQLMIDWHKSGLMPPDVWPAVSGAKYANGNEMFFNSDVPFYMSGSWNTGNVQSNVGDKFDWTVAPVPCGPAGCGVMPGGSGLVAFKSGDAAQEEAAAKFVAWMGSTDIAREWYSKTYAIPAHAGLQAEGLDYIGNGASQAVSDGLAAFTGMAAKAAAETPQAYQLQGSPKGFVMYNATVQYIGAALNDELSLDEAMAKIQEELDTNANQ
ncbi:ABC transporter substrate-binding protein [uncultured Pelagimonas sp.]|uniref:ABC transporter substrate-binding protein n=1 Tax=uncultured Pelagimonas sp. TaxID=1618102 RepID=UPI002639A7BE|nr:ABC transporter substrate-binding protein [uncultured Pelagimonas sp.]